MFRWRSFEKGSIKYEIKTTTCGGKYTIREEHIT
jgi:hypothetical protein